MCGYLGPGTRKGRPNSANFRAYLTISQHTPEEFVNDVAVVQPSSQIDIHVMSVTSGLAGPKLEHFNRDRLVGIWYRVLCVSYLPLTIFEVPYGLHRLR